MRKNLKRLRLSRETLRHLQPRALGGVKGGGGETYEIDTTCACTDTCDTCAPGGCGTGTCGCGTGTCNCTQELITTCVC
jgi:hypothetical protein